MRNRLNNAGFLDGTSDWSPIGVAALSVDEATLGRPGRAVLKATGAGAGEQGVRSIANLITAGLPYDCHGRWWASAGAPVLAAEWLDGGGAVIATDPLPQDYAASELAQWGIPSTFHRSYARLTAPMGAARVRLKLSAFPGGAYELALLKPYVGRPTATDNVLHWDPGPSSNPDLNAIPAWPHDLPPILWEGFGAPPTPVRASFSGNAGIPQTKRTGNLERTALKGRLRCSPVQVEILRQFHDSARELFWFVRPDTDELCLAQWLEDGQPTLQELAPGGGAYYGVGLLLAVA